MEINRARLRQAFAHSIFRGLGARSLARRLTALALLLGLGAAVAGPACAAPNPVKTIRIFNNSDKRIYPVIETPRSNADEWLQGVFRTTNIKRDTYVHTQVYRVYILPRAGIKPKESAIIRVPFYSELVNNPKGDKPDQYIDWWNGGRIYIYDDGPAVVKQLELDQAIKPKTGSIFCQANSNCGALTVYTRGGVGLPGNDPVQLMEYTFADVVTGEGVPFGYDPTHVDYDISYVDQTYLPLAIEPLNNKPVGYVGSTQDIPGFRDALERYLTATPGWPTYVGTPPYPNPRIPGAYNVFIGADLTPPGPAVQNMVAKWRVCTTPGGGGGDCAPYKEINDFFQLNYDQYTKLTCKPHLPLTETLLLQHVYGWVPFNENCVNAAAANALKDTPGYTTTHATYIALQLKPGAVFNPYVELIHSKGYLGMNAYSFSIDDAVGNMNEVGDGIIVTVGGPKGLANGKPFERDKIIVVSTGAPMKGAPTFKAYGICTNKPEQNLKTLGFSIYTVDYPCRVILRDSKQRDYTFVIRNAPPDPVVDCAQSTRPGWCKQINVSKNENNIWTLNTRAPFD